MIDLTHAPNIISLILEKLAEGQRVGSFIANVIAQTKTVSGVRAKSRHDTDPTRPTKRLLAIRIIELHAHLC